MNVERRRNMKRILVLLLGNALPLLLGLYGLKCIISLHGHLTEPNSQRMMHTFSLVRVEGMASVLAGLGYIFAALFAYLSAGSPPDEDRKMIWRSLRGVVRWGSLPAMWLFWYQAYLVRTGETSNFFGKILPDNDRASAVVASLLGVVFAILFLLAFLVAMFQREKVKADLYERGCQPLQVHWRPLAYWSFFGTAFRVVYRDAENVLHKAQCSVFISSSDSQSAARQVKWLKDEVRDFIDV